MSDSCILELQVIKIIFSGRSENAKLPGKTKTMEQLQNIRIDLPLLD